MGDYKVGLVNGAEDIHQILRLQSQYHRSSLTSEEMAQEGFVTCKHDYALLDKMNYPYPHVIATYGDNIVGYCLVMSADHRHELAVLESMFAMIDGQKINGRLLRPTEYIVMGQVCIDKSHRQKGLFRKMYEFYKDHLSPYYQYCVTEIAISNKRSLRAHRAVGFDTLLQYQANDGHQWELILWDWS